MGRAAMERKMRVEERVRVLRQAIRRKDEEGFLMDAIAKIESGGLLRTKSYWPAPFASITPQTDHGRKDLKVKTLAEKTIAIMHRSCEKLGVSGWIDWEKGPVGLFVTKQALHWLAV